jgi:hypothetical protein
MTGCAPGAGEHALVVVFDRRGRPWYGGCGCVRRNLDAIVGSLAADVRGHVAVPSGGGEAGPPSGAGPA